jgi:hypothetical protein
MKELILDPARLAEAPVYLLLKSASAGYTAVDHRFLAAILDRSDASIPDLVRFASEDHEKDPVNLSAPLVDIFRHLRATEAIPFLIDLVRREALDVDDDLVASMVQLGAAAVNPLLQLLEEIEAAGGDAGDVPFLLSQLRVRDARILGALTRRLAGGDSEAALFLDMYGDPAAIPALEAALGRLPESDVDRARIKAFIEDLASGNQRPEEQEEPFDIWPLYPKTDAPPLDLLDDEIRLTMLGSSSAELRANVAEFYRGSRFDEIATPRLLELAKTDPDARVRGECWESLEAVSDEPEVRRAMLGVLADAGASIEEKCGAAVALAQHTDNAAVFQAIEDLYADPRGRAKALKAMGRSLDRRFALYPPRHLDDPDAAIKRQAIWSVGYLNLSSDAPRLQAFFDQDEFRSDALFAYALSVPGETTRSRIRSLMNKIDEAAGGFSLEEQALVEIALDQRLMLHGKKPVFSEDESSELDDESEGPVVVTTKAGRNDPCPCGSGKKYKKCCGA